MSRLRWLAILMGIAILAISGFQGYWLKNNYDREKQALKIKTRSAFTETITKLQASKLQIENWSYTFDSAAPQKMAKVNVRKPITKGRIHSGTVVPGADITVINLLQERFRDSTGMDSTKSIVISYGKNNPVFFDSARRNAAFIRQRMDSNSILLQEEIFGAGEGHTIAPTTQPLRKPLTSRPPQANQFFRLMYNVDSLIQRDSLTINDIDSAYRIRLAEEKIKIPFTIQRIDSVDRDPSSDMQVTLGFSRPLTFKLNIGSTTSYFLNKLSLPILFSFLLVGISVLAFVLLYRGMIRQQKLIELKNDFISNISHELKTPIATMGVAIEAIKNFNVLNNREKTQEYLEISENELQRLNLLVDKVLKLSMFGKKEMELKFETVDLGEIVSEVVASMKLQMEKANAIVNLERSGDLSLQGDRIHLLSVIFNLLDNAIKYRRNDPLINITIEGRSNDVELNISDNGIGIPGEYQKRVFEKFFRVPAGNTHNAKGHGLGLSYVQEVIRKHKGTIGVISEPNKGTSFIISLPKQKL